MVFLNARPLFSEYKVRTSDMYNTNYARHMALCELVDTERVTDCG